MTYAPTSSGSRAAAFARALLLLALLTVGLPVLLIAGARARFDGGAPWSGMPDPGDWESSRIWSVLTERLTEQTVADIVIRSCLAVVWIALIVVVLTVVVEVAHMIRHAGLALPDVRGLGWSQQIARVIAVGLLVVVPMFGSGSRAIARTGVVHAPVGPSASAAAVVDGVRAVDESPTAEPVAAAGPSGTYVVRPGDSIYGIAERIAGADAAPDYADAVLERNLGRRMADGRQFTNAAFIDVGWELELPPLDTAGAVAAPVDGVHVVERGESLWSIADEELGDAHRWPEIYEANRGRVFDDRAPFDDPDLIRPGWDLNIPHVEVEPRAEPVDAPGTDGISHPADPPSVDVTPAASIPAGRHRSMPVRSGPAGSGDGDRARPENVWQGDDQPGGVPMLPIGAAAMMSAGVLALVAVRRRNRLRQARPRARLPVVEAGPAAVERALRATDGADRFRRVEAAIAAIAAAAVDASVRIAAVLAGADGRLVLHVTGPISLPAPWIATGDHSVWELAAATPVELLAGEVAPGLVACPTIVQLGRTRDGEDVFVDLEAMEAIEVGGPGDQADAIVRAVALTLAGSTLAEVTTLIGCGVDDAAFLGHRRHVAVSDARSAFAAAADAIGSTAGSTRTTFDLRVSGDGGEAWEPAVVVLGAAVGAAQPPADRTGLAVVSAAPIHGPSARLAPNGDVWELLPLGLRFVPVGVTEAELTEVAGLVAAADAAPVMDDGPMLDLGTIRASIDLADDRTLAPVDDSADLASPGAPSIERRIVEQSLRPELLVRLLGPVGVEARDGRRAAFERSKAEELVAWLATHRDRSTRTSARTALWELDVRDATFANVVSDARRTLARLVDPPDGEEWIARTLTEVLPLHHGVRTDAELVQEALDRSRLQPPAQAIATLEPVVELVVSTPFEGTSYLWPDAEGLTSQLVLLATTAAGELAAHHLSVGDAAGVLEATGRGLRVLPGHEELIALRMHAHARAGDRAGVRHEWEQYERVVHADPWSDGEPAERLVRLRHELLSQ